MVNETRLVMFELISPIQVMVSTVLGSAAPPMVVNLVRAVKLDSKDAPIVHDQVCFMK
jgi:hypothetical protein